MKQVDSKATCGRGDAAGQGSRTFLTSGLTRAWTRSSPPPRRSRTVSTPTPRSSTTTSARQLLGGACAGAGRMVYVGDLSRNANCRSCWTLPAASDSRYEGTSPGRTHAPTASRHGRLRQRGRRVFGLLRPTEVPAVIASAQVGLLFFAHVPNHEKAPPNKLFEYMAAGVRSPRPTCLLMSSSGRWTPARSSTRRRRGDGVRADRPAA